MKVWIVSLLLMFSGSVFSESEPLLSPCYSADIECLSKSTTAFLERTYQGAPQYNFLAIDPVNIASKDVDFGDLGVTYKNKNIIVTGLKHQTISEFTMNTATKSVVLTTKADITIVGDIAVVISKSAKTYSGSSTAKGSVLGTATYGYELKNDDTGVQHFEVGPETITCQVVATPETQVDPELLQALGQDDDFKKLPKEKLGELRSKAFCEIVKESYTSVIHNLRSAAKLLPASAFFKDVQ